MKLRWHVVLLLVSISYLYVPVWAHHGNTAYDTSKVVVLKNATVTRFAWANPHSFVMFDVKDDKGNIEHWAGEAGSPSALSLLGWTRTAIVPGDVITVYIFQSKTRNPVGRLQKIVLPDGTTYKDSALGYLDPDNKNPSNKSNP